MLWDDRKLYLYIQVRKGSEGRGAVGRSKNVYDHCIVGRFHRLLRKGRTVCMIFLSYRRRNHAHKFSGQLELEQWMRAGNLALPYVGLREKLLRTSMGKIGGSEREKIN